MLEQHRLSLKLQRVVTGQLFLAGQLHGPVYVWRDGLYTEVLPASSPPPQKAAIQNLVREGIRQVYVCEADVQEIRDSLDQALVRVTRALSVGEPRQNGARALKLMALNLSSLYGDPHDDELLMKQFQSTQNMSKFLIENRKLQPSFFQDVSKENFHFTILQPMLSSILLLGFLQSTHMFHEREIETLFLTSFMKDVGIGIIPTDKYDIRGLTLEEQKLFAHHAEFSHDILDGRIPLTKNQLNIIKHHHFLNERLKKILNKGQHRHEVEPMAFGLESTLVAVADIVVAMTTHRPYRTSMTLFQSMELIRKMIADEYPQEFRALVVFLRQFFRN